MCCRSLDSRVHPRYARALDYPARFGQGAIIAIASVAVPKVRVLRTRCQAFHVCSRGALLRARAIRLPTPTVPLHASRTYHAASRAHMHIFVRTLVTLPALAFHQPCHSHDRPLRADVMYLIFRCSCPVSNFHTHTIVLAHVHHQDRMGWSC